MHPNRRRFRLLAAAALAATPTLRAQDISAQAILQLFESSHENVEKRAPDIFMAGYGGLWTPPPGRAEQGDVSVGYDVYDRFDLGSAAHKTLYGTETGMKTAVSEIHKIGANYYSDLVWNHNGFADYGTPGFVQSGAYPGFKLPETGDVDGDFHSSFDSGDFKGRTSNLIDIAQEKNYQYIRNPVPGFANNLPAGTASSYAGGSRIANVALESNRRFYPDLQGPSTTVNGVTYYKFNTTTPSAGDPVSENATGYLMRQARWMVEVVGVDGFRLDATKHMIDLSNGNPDWVLEFYDVAVNGARKTLLDGSDKRVFAFGEYLDTNLGIVQNSIKKDANANRDALDFAMHYSLKNYLTGNGFTNDWRNIVNDTQDRQDDGLANNGSQGVAFDASHDDGGAYLGNVANAYLMMRPGNAIIYMNAKEFGTGRAFPKDGRGDALGGYYGSVITKLVDIRNSYGRGNYQERWIDKETLVFERFDSVIAAYNNRVDAGYDTRTVNTAFAPGTHLIELTGNATDGTVDPLNDIYDVVTVAANGQITIRIPRNTAPGAGGVEHKKGYVMYGPATPRGTFSVSNVASTLAAETPTAATNGTARLTPIDIIKASTFNVTLQTTSVILPDGYNDLDAGGDNANLKFDGGLDVNGNGFVDFTSPNGTAYGFENFVTKKSPRYTGGDGEYIQTVNTDSLSEGYHYITARAYRHRAVAGTAIYKDFRKVIYVDRQRPQSVIDSFLPISGQQDDLDIVVKSVDKTATGMHVFHNIGANFTPDQLVAMATGGGGTAGEYDRDLYKFGSFDWKDGNQAITVVTFEVSFDSGLGYAGGGVNVQRFVGIPFANGAGIGLGDTDFNGSYGLGDVTTFSTVLSSNNTSFNPAADLNADGFVDEPDNILLLPWLTFKGANAGTLNSATNLRVTRATNASGNGILYIPSGQLDVSGTLVPGVPLNVTNSFNIPANFTVTKTGGETLNLSGLQSHGLNSGLLVNEGTVNFNTNPGANLTVTVNGAAALVNFNNSQQVKSLILTAGKATLTGTNKVLTANTVSATGGQLDLLTNDMIVKGMTRPDVEALVKAGFGNFDWLGTGITSSSAAAFAQTDSSRALGVIRADEWGYTTFDGQTVSGSDVLVKYTWVGDANVDGLVDNDDFGQFLYGFSGGGSATWLNGDFDFSGTIDNDDFGNFLNGMAAFNASGNTQLSESFQSELANFATANGIPLVLDPAPVPEPGAALLALSGISLLASRRRKHSPINRDEIDRG